MSLLEIALYLIVAFLGAAVVFNKSALKQTIVYGIFGTALALLFFVLMAPDVALSELAVGTLAIPMMVLVTLMKTADKL